MPSATWPAFQREVGLFGLRRGKEPFFLVFIVQTPMQPPRPTEMCHLLITFPIPGADHSSPTQGAVGEHSGQVLEAPGTFASTSLCIFTSFCTPHAKTRPPTCPAETSQFRIKKETALSHFRLQVPKKGSHTPGLGQMSASGPITMGIRSGQSVSMAASYGNCDDPTSSGDGDIKTGNLVFLRGGRDTDSSCTCAPPYSPRKSSGISLPR